MTTFQRTIVSLLCLLVVAIPGSLCAGKPTHEQIVAFAEKCKNEKKRIDLVAEFGGDFSGLDLSGVDFRGYYARSNRTYLRNANFSSCNLYQAQFGGAVLDGADFTGANLERATFVTASLRQVTLLRVNLKGTQFYQTDLTGAKLTRADLSSADITGSNFGGGDLSDVLLSGAKNDYWWNDFSNANLTRANLAGLELNGASFQNAVLRSADLSNTQLIQANFAQADLTEASFENANVESAVFRNVQGLTKAQRDQLEGEAQRWKFEIKTGVARFLTVMYFPTYALVIIALVGLSFCALRGPCSPRSINVVVVVNLLALLPACALFGMSLLGAAPTVQFNIGSSIAMELWSAWVVWWPLFMLLLLACLIVAVGAALVFLASTWRWTALKREKLTLLYMALTIVHCLFAMHWVGNNFPNA